MKITSLTSTQQRKLTAHRDQWLAFGLRTGPTDRAKAEAACRLAYQCAELEPPKLILWFGSPLAGCYAAAWFLALSRVRPQSGGPADVWAQVGAQVRDQVRAQVGAQVGAQVYRCGYGSHDAGWLSFYAAMAQFGVDLPKLPGLLALLQCGWWWPFAGAVVLTELPVEIHRDSAGRLHRTDGPAISYSDGFGVWAWHGIRVPRWVIEHPEKITVQEINAEKNDETRRVMIERYGMARYLDDSGATPISEAVDEGGQLMQLYAIGPIRRLRLRNSTIDPDGTVREYMRRVPSRFDDVWEARNWTCYLAPGERYSVVS